MCSIFGYCGPVPDRTAFEKAFAQTKSRGPDDSRVIGAGDGLIASLNGCTAVCNGELYGFTRERAKLLEKGYTFQSDSDCEILLPMYFEYGTDLFRKLDAEFACVIWDGRSGEWIAARDPIGIRPLYYGYDRNGTILFASEAKNLVGLAGKIMPFPPGHYYKGGRFVCYHDPAKVDATCRDDVETACKQIREKLVAGVESWTVRSSARSRRRSALIRSRPSRSE